MNILTEEIHVKLWRHGLVCQQVQFSHLQIQDVGCELVIPLFILDVLNHEDAVESGQNGGLELDLAADLCQRVEGAMHGVGRGQHTRATVENGGDARFCNTDGLLLHRLMDRHPVLGLHLVELVYTHHSPIRQHHGPPFQTELSRRRVSYYTGSEPCTAAALATRVYGDGRGLLHEFEELRLGSGRVSDQ